MSEHNLQCQVNNAYGVPGYVAAGGQRAALIHELNALVLDSEGDPGLIIGISTELERITGHSDVRLNSSYNSFGFYNDGVLVSSGIVPSNEAFDDYYREYETFTLDYTHVVEDIRVSSQFIVNFDSLIRVRTLLDYFNILVAAGFRQGTSWDNGIVLSHGYHSRTGLNVVRDISYFESPLIQCIDTGSLDTTVNVVGNPVTGMTVTTTIIDGDNEVSNVIQSPDGRTSVVTNDGEIRANVNDSNIITAVDNSISISRTSESQEEESSLVLTEMEATLSASMPPPRGSDPLVGEFSISPTTARIHTDAYLTGPNEFVMDDESIRITKGYNFGQPGIEVKQFGDVVLTGARNDIGCPTNSNLFLNAYSIEANMTRSQLSTGAVIGGTGTSFGTILRITQFDSQNTGNAELLSGLGDSTEGVYETEEPFVPVTPASLTTKQYVDGAIEDRTFTKNPDGSIILSVINDEGVLVGSLSIGASGHGIFTASESFGISSGGNSIGVDRGGVRLNRINFSTEEIMRLKQLAQVED